MADDRAPEQATVARSSRRAVDDVSFTLAPGDIPPDSAPLRLDTPILAAAGFGIPSFGDAQGAGGSP